MHFRIITQSFSSRFCYFTEPACGVGQCILSRDTIAKQTFHTNWLQSMPKSLPKLRLLEACNPSVTKLQSSQECMTYCTSISTGIAIKISPTHSNMHTHNISPHVPVHREMHPKSHPIWIRPVSWSLGPVMSFVLRWMPELSGLTVCVCVCMSICVCEAQCSPQTCAWF